MTKNDPIVASLLRNSGHRLDYAARQLEAHKETHRVLQETVDAGARWLDMRQHQPILGRPYFIRWSPKKDRSPHICVAQWDGVGWASVPGFQFTAFPPSSDDNPVHIYTK